MICLNKNQNNVVALTLREKLPVSFSATTPEYLFWFQNDQTNEVSTDIYLPVIQSWRYDQFNINISASTILNQGSYDYQIFAQASGSTNTDITFSGCSLVEVGKLVISGNNNSISSVYL